MTRTGAGGERPGSPSLEALLARMASASPDAGGGSAAALAGALAAALLAMVGGLTGTPSGTTDPAVAGVEALRHRLVALVEQDTEAYREVLRARRAPPDRREAALREALVQATEIPAEVAEAGVRILRDCVAVADRARASVVPDLGVAGILAGAAVQAGALLARTNLGELDDAAREARTRARLARLEEEATALRHRLAGAIERRG